VVKKVFVGAATLDQNGGFGHQISIKSRSFDALRLGRPQGVSEITNPRNQFDVRAGGPDSCCI